MTYREIYAFHASNGKTVISGIRCTSDNLMPIHFRYIDPKLSFVRFNYRQTDILGANFTVAIIPSLVGSCRIGLRLLALHNLIFLQKHINQW